jgi:hypothetical protein
MVEFSTAKSLCLSKSTTKLSSRGSSRRNESGAVAKTEKTFEEALQSIKPRIEEARGLTDLIERPAEAEIEFGLDIDAGAEAVFAKAGGTATFSIKLTSK